MLLGSSVRVWLDRVDDGSICPAYIGCPLAGSVEFVTVEVMARNLKAAGLAGRVLVGPELVQTVEKGQRRAGPGLIRDCDAVLDTDGSLGRLLAFVAHTEQVSTPRSEPELAPEPLRAAAPMAIMTEITALDVPNRRVAPVGSPKHSGHRRDGEPVQRRIYANRPQRCSLRLCSVTAGAKDAVLRRQS